MIRITTNGALRTYKSGLMQSSNNLTSARNKVLSHRNFSAFSEDPAAAVQAFQIRRSFAATSSQLTTNKSIVKKFETAYDILDDVIEDMGVNMSKIPGLRGENDPTGSGRQPLGEVLSSSAESMVQSLNSQYNGNFIFAGNDGENVPFAWKEEVVNGQTVKRLTYRGIPVDCEKYKTNADGTTSTEYTDDYKKLMEYSKDAAYVDLGMGLREDNTGKLITASAYNQSISGADIMDFGVDEDGDPKNIISISMRLSEIYGRCDPDTGDYAPGTTDAEDAERLVGKLQSSLDELSRKHTEMSARTTFLKTNQKRLEDTAYNLNDQLLDIEQVDLADAITEFSWAQYCYNASLKVGNSILSQSLIDYMS